MEVAEARPESDALPVLDDDKPIESKQLVDRPEEMVPMAAEVDAPFSCQEADTLVEEGSAASATGVPGPMMGGNGTPCMR